jgi:methyltransferase (TIGR00027 family)
MSEDTFKTVVKARFSSKANQHNKKQAHQTSESSAMLRAMVTKIKDAAVSCPDYLAPEFLTRSYRKLLPYPWITRRIAEFINPGALGHILSRTRFTEKHLLHAIRQGLDQLIILGAGCDTRAYRYKEQLKNTRIFEVDFPATQQQKIVNLEHSGIDHSHVSFCPLDMNLDSLEHTLLKFGFNKGLRNFFIWEGVTFYIERRAVRDMFQFIQKVSVPGSMVTFDYFHTNMILQNNLSKKAKRSVRFHEKLGEPFVHGWKDNEVAEYLEKMGFSIIQHMYPQEMTRKYLTGRTEKVYAKPFEWIRLVAAQVR